MCGLNLTGFIHYKNKTKDKSGCLQRILTRPRILQYNIQNFQDTSQNQFKKKQEKRKLGSLFPRKRQSTNADPKMVYIFELSKIVKQLL